MYLGLGISCQRNPLISTITNAPRSSRGKPVEPGGVPLLAIFPTGSLSVSVGVGPDAGCSGVGVSVGKGSGVMLGGASGGCGSVVTPLGCCGTRVTSCRCDAGVGLETERAATTIKLVDVLVVAAFDALKVVLRSHEPAATAVTSTLVERLSVPFISLAS